MALTDSNPVKELIAGIDIGGTKCTAVLGFENEGNICIQGKRSFFTDSFKTWDQSLERICTLIQELLVENAGFKLSSIGISCGGPLDLKKGYILSPPNLPGWDNVPVVEYIRDRLGTKAYLQNDANACALAEWHYGAGRGCSSMIFLTFGTGIGAGLILDGRLYIGANGMAGEVGHIRMEKMGPMGYGKKGSFEGFCSGGGIARLAEIKVKEKLLRGEIVSFCHGYQAAGSLDAKTIAEAALSGDETALEIFNISAHYLGMGLSMMIDMLNPERIIIGSIFERCPNLLWPEAHKVVMKEALAMSADACMILPAELGDNIGDYAALSVGLYGNEISIK